MGGTMAMPELVMCPLTLRSELFECTPEQYRGLLDLAVRYGYGGVAVGALDVGIADAAGVSLDAFLEEIRDRGLRAPIVEAVSGWGQGAAAEEIEAQARPVMEIAARAGADTVVALSMEATVPSIEVAAAGFSQVCALGEEYGLRVSVEFFPWGGISDLATAWHLVKAAGADNGGIVLDTWHWGRASGGPDFETLRAIPPEKIHVVQIDDASAEPWEDAFQETLRARLLPGDGVVDIVGVLRVLRERGATPHFAPEVFNAELHGLGVEDMARRVAEATRRVLNEAGYA